MLFLKRLLRSNFFMRLLNRVIFLLVLNGIFFQVYAQTDNSTYLLKQKLKQLEQKKNYLQDTVYANTLLDLAYIYSTTYPDSALRLLAGNAERCRLSGYRKGEADTYMIIGDAYQLKGMYDKALENYEQLYTLAKHINYDKAIPLTLNRIGMIDLNRGNYPEALSKFYESLKAAEAIQNLDLVGATFNNIAVVNFYQGKFNEAEAAYRQRLKVAQQIADTSSISLAYNGLGEVNLQQKKPGKALQNLTIAYNLASKINDREMMLTISLSMADAYYETDSLQKAETLFENALNISNQADHGTYICNALIGLARVKSKQGLLKEALAKGLKGLQKAQDMGQVQLMRDANEIVSGIYERLNDGNNALKYFKAYKVYADSINSLASERAATVEKARYEFSKKESEFQRKALQQWWIIFSAFAALFLLSIIIWLINRNRKGLHLNNKELHKKNEIIEIQKLKAEQTLAELKSTQAQLIQSEKMASLGELTAGIAHEIQNPLNFVTNFSEINKEMIDEAAAEIEKGNVDDAKTILNDIKENSEKINHHGKRADSIVKGMLQHSRVSTGVKEPTNINALADEYLRLSYHGLRAKDKSFNANFKTDFDDTIEKINIIPQDIGRVLLNLFNNAFYAANKKLTDHNSPITADYKPLVSVQTKKEKDDIIIVVADNGNGIPQNIIDKIFQPFFTTKPTGQGTGLGLSLSYDIIKAHGGELRVETKEGEGSNFYILLPTANKK